MRQQLLLAALVLLAPASHDCFLLPKRSGGSVSGE